MMGSAQDHKLDKLLEDVAVIRTVTDHHTKELQELKTKLDPVFFHVTGMRWLGKLVISGIGAGGLLVAIIELLIK